MNLVFRIVKSSLVNHSVMSFDSFQGDFYMAFAKCASSDLLECRESLSVAELDHCGTETAYL